MEENPVNDRLTKLDVISFFNGIEQTVDVLISRNELHQGEDGRFDREEVYEVRTKYKRFDSKMTRE